MPIWEHYHKLTSVDNLCNWTCTLRLCNRTFQKLNADQAMNHLLEITVKGVAVCLKITHEQCRALPGGCVVTNQKDLDTLIKPTFVTGVDDEAL